MWLLPSRRRPASLARFFAAFAETGGTTPGMVLVDRGDWGDLRADYEALRLPLGWHFRLTEGETQGDKIREAWGDVEDCAWLGLVGDDCVPETQLWDRRLQAHLDRALIVSCDDGWQAPERLGNCWIMAGALVRRLGYIFPPGLAHLYVDDVWEAIGRGAACWHCDMAVKVAHRHVLKGEAVPDGTHTLVYGAGAAPGGGLWPADGEAYKRWLLAEERGALAAASELRPTPPSAPDDPIDRSHATEAARAARVKSRRLMICSPLHDGSKWQYTSALYGTGIVCERMGVAQQLQFVAQSSNLPKARNELCAWFLASDCTDLVFVDGDMGWAPNSVLRLLASEQPVIAAVGRRKKPGTPSWCVRFLPDAGKSLHQDAMGAIEVLEVGTGFMRITRDALLRIIASRPDLRREGDAAMDPSARPHYYKFFRFGDADEGEDYEFCRLFRSVGGNIWVDPSIELVHVGDVEYSGRLADALVAALPEPAKEAAD